MATKRPTKAQLFAHLQSVAISSDASKHMDSYTSKIVREAVDVNDLKDILVHKANKFYCIRRQIEANKDIQWYGGERFCYSAETTNRVLMAVHTIAEKMNYEVYSPNGFWFIKSY